ncbi:hypothetical protein ACU686_43735 [Yinghuangia aomiensis]
MVPQAPAVQHDRPETQNGLPVRPLVPRAAHACTRRGGPVPGRRRSPHPAAAPAAPAGPRHAAVPEQRPTTPVADAATYRPAEDAGLAPLPGGHVAPTWPRNCATKPARWSRPPFAADSPEAARDMYRGLQAAFDQAEQPDRIDNADSAEDTPAPR